MNANDSAFPYDHRTHGVDVDSHEHGLTKREYFAAAIIQGMLANPECITGWARMAAQAVVGADALIAELSKPKEESK